MARRSSNRDRIDRMREEAAAKERERRERREREAAAPGTTRKRKPAGDGRMKMVWAVKDGRGEIVKTYPYPRKEDALAEARRLTDAGKAHIVTPHKVSFYE
jgi:hypothetical protein